jgi:hypothetical protein
LFKLYELKSIACKLNLEQGDLRRTSQPLNVESKFYRSFCVKSWGPSIVKWTKKYVHSIPNLKYGSFEYKHIKIDSKLFKSLIMESSTLSLGFDELNIKFEKLW